MIPVNIRKNAIEHYLSLSRMLEDVNAELRSVENHKANIQREMGEYNDFFRVNGISQEEIQKYHPEFGTSDVHNSNKGKINRGTVDMTRLKNDDPRSLTFSDMKAPQPLGTTFGQPPVHAVCTFINGVCACGERD